MAADSVTIEEWVQIKDALVKFVLRVADPDKEKTQAETQILPEIVQILLNCFNS